MTKLIQLDNKDIPELRKKWWLENNKKCPIINTEIPLSETVLDHKHKRKSDIAGEDGLGLCRNCISRCANLWEGRVCNSFKRVGLSKYIDIISALRNLANYLEYNHTHDDIKYIHPSEKPKKKKLKKTSYNKLIKSMKDNNDIKQIPKYTGNLTKTLSKLFNIYKIIPEFYKDNK